MSEQEAPRVQSGHGSPASILPTGAKSGEINQGAPYSVVVTPMNELVSSAPPTKIFDSGKKLSPILLMAYDGKHPCS